MKVIFKRLAGFFIFIVISALFGCASGLKIYVYDDTIPQEQLCTLTLRSGYHIKEFDHRPVNWEVNPNPFVLDPYNNYTYAVAKIPSGSHAFLLDWTNSFEARNDKGERVNVTRTSNDYVLSYDNFVAGKNYELKYKVTGEYVNITVEEVK
jgi:hypothetical protein